jgi:hypothetical protein
MAPVLHPEPSIRGAMRQIQNQSGLLPRTRQVTGGRAWGHSQVGKLSRADPGRREKRFRAAAKESNA